MSQIRYGRALKGIRPIVAIKVAMLHIGIFPNKFLALFQFTIFNMTIFFLVAGFANCATITSVMRPYQAAEWVTKRVSELQSVLLVMVFLMIPLYTAYCNCWIGSPSCHTPEARAAWVLKEQNVAVNVVGQKIKKDRRWIRIKVEPKKQSEKIS